jgi:phosphocarrier protein
MWNSGLLEIRRELTIQNREGLHFRPIIQLVECAQKFRSSLKVTCEDREADGRSPMELLMLIAPFGSTIQVICSGDDAQELVEALSELIRNGFGECDEPADSTVV